MPIESNMIRDLIVNPITGTVFAALITSDSKYNMYRLTETTQSENTFDINGLENIPTEYILSQNYPNPFNPSTVIKYQLPEVAQVSLVVYDIMGREIATLVNGFQNAGSYDVTFNANGLSSGIYFYKLNANGKQLINKMLLMK
jgi:hypothetical protein